MSNLASIAIAAALLISCAPAPPPAVEPPKPDPAQEPWYAQTVEELEQINREALAAFNKRRFERAGELITKAQPLMQRLIAIPRPTLRATEAASEVDDLYGRILMANHHYGWARLQFQKNVARWSNWQPQTEHTQQLLKQARERLAECDRRLQKDMARP